MAATTCSGSRAGPEKRGYIAGLVDRPGYIAGLVDRPGYIAGRRDRGEGRDSTHDKNAVNESRLSAIS